MVQERRRYPRIIKSLPIKLAGGEYDIVTDTKNISANGAFCAIGKPLPVMTKLDIVLLIPLKKNKSKAVRKINCTGVIVRGENTKDNGKFPYSVGIYFSEIKPRDRKVLLAYIDSHLQPTE